MNGREIKYRLIAAAKKGNSAEVRTLFSTHEEECQTKALRMNVLHTAVRHGHAESVAVMLQCLPDLACTRDLERNTPLHIAAKQGHIRICEMLVPAWPEACFEANNSGMNPIHVAAMMGKADVLRYLLRDQTFPAARHKVADRGTILHLCVENNQLDLLIGAELLEEVDRDGNTAQHLAVLMGRTHFIRHLVDNNRVQTLHKNSRGKSEIEDAGSPEVGALLTNFAEPPHPVEERNELMITTHLNRKYYDLNGSTHHQLMSFFHGMCWPTMHQFFDCLHLQFPTFLYCFCAGSALYYCQLGSE